MMRILLPVLVLGLVAAAGCGPNETLLPTEPNPGPACLPNLDGVIDAAEMPARLDLGMSFFVSPSGQTRTVDVDGRIVEQQRWWDWSAHAPEDHVHERVAGRIDDRWYAAHFSPGADGEAFALAVDTDGALEAVYTQSDDALRLHGLASVEPGRTVLPYEEPVAIVRFPLQPGTEWSASGRVNDGVFNRFPYRGTDTYQVRDDAIGRLDLPELAFTQVHRLRTTLTVAPDGATPVTVRHVQFLFECFGEVARATSAAGEINDDFTTATEVRRFKQ